MRGSASRTASSRALDYAGAFGLLARALYSADWSGEGWSRVEQSISLASFLTLDAVEAEEVPWRGTPELILVALGWASAFRVPELWIEGYFLGIGGRHFA